jgi:hypothetical protein
VGCTVKFLFPAVQAEITLTIEMGGRDGYSSLAIEAFLVLFADGAFCIVYSTCFAVERED